MKKKFQLQRGYVIILALGFVLSSCCTKKDCLNAFDYKEITLTGFSQQEAETVTVSSYIQGSNFADLIESDTVSARLDSSNGDGDLNIWVPFDFNPKSDYSIELKKTGLSYKITEIGTSLKKCNTCFLTEDTYTVLSTYKVNGQLYLKSKFEIIK